tara:strand:- start:384 stop:986 length:603 start_codon:yes stop_codon:yes gene_type:complete
MKQSTKHFSHYFYNYKYKILCSILIGISILYFTLPNIKFINTGITSFIFHSHSSDFSGSLNSSPDIFLTSLSSERFYSQVYSHFTKNHPSYSIKEAKHFLKLDKFLTFNISKINGVIRLKYSHPNSKVLLDVLSYSTSILSDLNLELKITANTNFFIIMDPPFLITNSNYNAFIAIYIIFIILILLYWFSFFIIKSIKNN